MTVREPLSEEMLDEIKEIFAHFDTNKNNRIETSEFRNLLLALGQVRASSSTEDASLIDGEVEAGIEALDANRNGTIEFNELLEWWADR